MLATSALVGYRFRGVELDLARGVLRVDGVEIAAPPLPLRLLSLLCERAGVLCTRDEIFATVWPRQEISDDALNKLISRVRELLGAHADALVTVRKQGLRLDAVVERVMQAVLAEKVPPSPPTEEVRNPVGHVARAAGYLTALDEQGVSSSRLRRQHDLREPVRKLPGPVRARSLFWALAALAVTAILALVWLRVPAPATTSERLAFSSYALRESDLRASRPETAELLRAAEAAFDRSDSEQARQLLQSAERSDPVTPVLPTLRAIHHGSAETESVDALVARARERLVAQDHPYVRLLIDYAAARGLEEERAAVDALLTLRPEAWRLRLRRAHIDIQGSNRDGALRHLRSIPVDQAPPQTAMFVLADRVSFGDSKEVEAALKAGALAEFPLQRRYIEARLLWTRQSPDVGARLRELGDDAEAGGAYVLAAHARELAAAEAYLRDDPQADALLRRAAFALKKTGRASFAGRLLGLQAELAHRTGQGDLARELLNQAKEATDEAAGLVELEILSARLQLLPRGSLLETAGGTDDRFGRGEPALVAGWHAFINGAPTQAHAALAEARASGIERSAHAESAALLGVELGEAKAGCWLDPPYPDLLRLASCRLLRRAAVP